MVVTAVPGNLFLACSSAPRRAAGAPAGRPAAAAIRDLVRLVYCPWDGRPDLREDLAGYGRALTSEEDETLFCYAVIDALSGLRGAWPTATTRLSAAPGGPSNDRLTCLPLAHS